MSQSQGALSDGVEVPRVPSVTSEALVDSYTWRSSIPTQARGAVPCILGVDEAGRGPVLGPLVYGIAYCPAAWSDELGKVGFADSKALTAERRDALLAALIDNPEHLGWATRVMSPQDISAGMLRRRPHNLNAQSTEATVELISGVLEAGVDIAEIYVDTVGDPVTYCKTLKSYFPQAKYRHIEWTVTSKADAIYPIVGAASIAAKVTRDRWVEDWKYAERLVENAPPSCNDMSSVLQETQSTVNSQSQSQAESQEDSVSVSPKKKDTAGAKKRKRGAVTGPALDPIAQPRQFWHQFGSGYPGDPNTVAYLHRALDPVFGWPGLVRFSWATIKTLLEEKVRVAPTAAIQEEPSTGRRSSARAGASQNVAAKVATPSEAVESSTALGCTGCHMPRVGQTKGFKVTWVDEAAAAPKISAFFSAAKPSPGASALSNLGLDTSLTATSIALFRQDAERVKRERVGLTKDLGLHSVGAEALITL